MFLRKIPRRKNGKSHAYWALMESFRTARGPRNRVVAYLGELAAEERRGWARLAHQLSGTPVPVVQPSLFDLRPAADPVPEQVTVNVAGVRVERTADFGDVWLALTLWHALGLDALFAALLPQGRERVPWAAMVAVLVAARFCRPSSERQIEQAWYAKTALPELLGVPGEQVYLQRLYRTLDALVPHKEAVEKHLKERLGELFDLDYELLIYDVTSTYFEGDALGNPQAKRGYSRDKRSDCKQVCIALVVTTDGMPLGYEVFDGNRTDVTTVEEIVEAMEAKYGTAQRIWAMDRGMVKEDTLQFLRARGGRYIVGTPRSHLRRYESELTERGWSAVYEDLEVKLCPSPDGGETFVLCRSTARATKERAMHDRFSARIEDGLETLRRRLARARTRPSRPQVERQLGRLLQKNSRAAGKYRVEVRDDPDRPRPPASRVDVRADVEPVGHAQRRRLPAPHQPGWMGARSPVADLHATHRRRSRVPHPQVRPGPAPDLPPGRAPGPRPHPGRVPRVCPVEDAAEVDGSVRPRPWRRHRRRGTGPHQVQRDHPPHRVRPGASTPLHHPAGQVAEDPSGTPEPGVPPSPGPAEVANEDDTLIGM